MLANLNLTSSNDGGFKEEDNTGIDNRSIFEKQTRQTKQINQYDFFGFHTPEDTPSVFDRNELKLMILKGCSRDELTKHDRKFLKACKTVDCVVPQDAGALGFYMPYLAKCSIPYKKLVDKKTGKPVTEFQRRNGNQQVTLNGLERYGGLPYGMIARRLLIYIVTIAVLHKKAEIEIKSYRNLCANINCSYSNQNLKLIHAAIFNLFGTTLFFEVLDDNSVDILETTRINVIKGLYIDDTLCPNVSDKKSKPNRIVLDDSFFNYCRDHGCPIDMRIINTIQSPMEFDVYAFLNVRLLSVKKRTQIPWDSFIKQFGTCAKDDRSIKQRLKIAIEKVVLRQPGLNVTFDNDNVYLRPSRRYIPKRKVV